MTKEEFTKTGLCEQYVLGLTSPEESELVEQMLVKHPELKKDCMKLEGCMEKYARAHAIPPPATLKESVLSKVDKIAAMERAARNNISIPKWIVYSTAASLVGLLFFSFSAWNGKSKVENEMAVLSTEFQQFQKDCEQVENDKMIFASQNTFLKDLKTTHIHLRGGDNSLAIVYWNENKDKAYLKLENLPPPPAGKTYQIWADIDSKMVDMGVINYDDKKMISIPYMANAASLNITLEEAGGSDHPDVSQLKVSGVI
ncbi:MAG: anti-sigma-K factor RskA [Granulosicoccus sp.]|jgi:anti-sigma-K factor RskA